jgi:hypothetical protein
MGRKRKEKDFVWVAVRLPEGLLTLIEGYAKTEFHLSRSAAILDLLERGIGAQIARDASLPEKLTAAVHANLFPDEP